MSTNHSSPVTDNDHEAELFAAATKIDLAAALKHIRDWTQYISEHHRQNYADLMEAQAKLIAWLVNTRSAPAQCAATIDELGGWIEHGLCYGISSKDARTAARQLLQEFDIRAKPSTVTSTDGGRTTVWPTGTGNTPQDVQLASLVTRPDGGGGS